MLAMVDPSLSAASKRSQPFKDVVSRTMMSNMLIKDRSGKLEAMNASSGHNHDAGIEFGQEVESTSEELQRR